MSYKGIVRGDVVVLEGSVKLPDGASVRVDLVDPADEAEGPSLLERLGTVIGKAKGLPADAARNVDRDLYGADPT